MNVYELTTQVLRQCRFDVTDEQDREENQDWIVAELNYAYRQICRDRLHPWTTEEVTLDENKCFDTRTLDSKLVRINKIAPTRDYANGAYIQCGMPWDMYDGGGKVIVPTAKAGSTVYVEYELMFPDLEVMAEEADETFEPDATNTPQIAEQWHPILTYWATAQYFLGKGPNYTAMASMWMNMYDRESAFITDDIGQTQTVIGANTPWI